MAARFNWLRTDASGNGDLALQLLPFIEGPTPRPEEREGRPFDRPEREVADHSYGPKW
jgi:hypothetical protein